MKELGVQMIPAYSPQARGRCERSFGTWQNRLPQELRLAGISTLEQANEFLREHYLAEFNRKFAKPAAEKGTAFRKCTRKDLDWVFSIQTERSVAHDNTIALQNRYLQLDKTRFRNTLAGCTVTHLKTIESKLVTGQQSASELPESRKHGPRFDLRKQSSSGRWSRSDEGGRLECSDRTDDHFRSWGRYEPLEYRKEFACDR
jgi:hypothetical protein